jgi:hypothetical protein
MLINLIKLITEIEDLAIGLGLSLITAYDADDLLCQFASNGTCVSRIGFNPGHEARVIERSFAAPT